MSCKSIKANVKIKCRNKTEPKKKKRLEITYIHENRAV